ncbi:MAG: hypothetical protein Kow0020_06180 [Wenzhouxiangellaceae bacterium]
MDTRTAWIILSIIVAPAAMAQSAAPAWQLVHDAGPIHLETAPRLPGQRPAENDTLLATTPVVIDLPGRVSLTLPRGEHSTMTLFSPSGPAFSLSLESWEMNTASLAHIQCGQAIQTLDHLLARDCHFTAGSNRYGELTRLRGQWHASPSLAVGASVYSGYQPHPLASLAGAEPWSIPVRLDGFNVNLNYGVDLGWAGDLVLGVQLDRYKQRSEQPFGGLQSTLWPWISAATGLATLDSGEPLTAGGVGIGWRGEHFGADLSGQYQELPYWLGKGANAPGFSTFDIEFSWRGAASNSLSIGVSNVLDNRPGESGASETAADEIFGRIPYVRYKHDL